MAAASGKPDVERCTGLKARLKAEENTLATFSIGLNCSVGLICTGLIWNRERGDAGSQIWRFSRLAVEIRGRYRECNLLRVVPSTLIMTADSSSGVYTQMRVFNLSHSLRLSCATGVKI